MTVNPIERLDTPAAVVEAEARRIQAQRQVDESVAKLRYLLAHPAEFATPAPEGLRAEYSHLLHDADADAVTRPFVDLRKGTTWRTP
ncbi:hypothetical protein [Streptomyces venezuelae]|uniref:hypothetical protein n=1 Tax=Streptomyces venezuelae TaxID=54571 RepID=UPI0016896882|nr:hypothetical protein [Streptomyces venezuelae]